MKSIEHIILRDADERYAPVSMPVLNVTVVGDQLFLAIEEQEETHTTRSSEILASMSLDLKEFLSAIEFLMDRQ